jgi:hypothetical protein
VTVSVLVQNFYIVDKLGQANAPGEGHIHYFLDAEPPVMQGSPAVTAAGTYAATTGTSHTWRNVGPGDHTFAVQLVNNDHTPLDPPVTRMIAVTAAVPRITILSPGEGGIVGPDTFTVTVNVQDFHLSDNLGGPNVPGEGHIHYYLDATPPITPGQVAIPATGRYFPSTASSYTWSNVTSGFHTVAVQLVNNDHTPVIPPVSDSITVLMGREGVGGSGGGGY